MFVCALFVSVDEAERGCKMLTEEEEEEEEEDDEEDEEEEELAAYVGLSKPLLPNMLEGSPNPIVVCPSTDADCVLPVFPGAADVSVSAANLRVSAHFSRKICKESINSNNFLSSSVNVLLAPASVGVGTLN